MNAFPTTKVLRLRPGLNLNVREAGQGEAVLVLHGASGPDSIDTLLDHLSVGHRVLAPTHPGWGGTQRPDELSSVTDLAATYLDLFDQLAVTRATVIGPSFGGWVAAEMAVTDRAHRIERLVLIDAIGPRIPGHRLTMPGPPPPSAVPAPAEAAPRGPWPAALAALRAYGGEALQDPTLLGRFGDVLTPTLLIWGENDPVVSAGFGRAYADAVPNARFALIPDAGHLPIREAPDETFAAIDAFLADETLTKD
ncbi:alpha/beta hydrolase [Micromonospora sp. NBC_01405]|uniref:alpha/beta fold hydrolase n=1 Tax=Micromonospora sp. NBC_01405 TaxID=2903589 RepID=UPI00324EF618